jgi:NAD(P)-dependent dehydrogenase (short-subunit alcohol dehydrogenase family)
MKTPGERTPRYMSAAAVIINLRSINSDEPSSTLLPYPATKAVIADFTASLAQLVADRDIRANSVVRGPDGTPLPPSTMPPEKVENVGWEVPMNRRATS